MGVPFELGKSLHVFSLLKRFRQHFEREMAHWLYMALLSDSTSYTCDRDSNSLPIFSAMLSYAA